MRPLLAVPLLLVPLLLAPAGAEAADLFTTLKVVVANHAGEHTDRDQQRRVAGRSHDRYRSFADHRRAVRHRRHHRHEPRVVVAERHCRSHRGQLGTVIIVPRGYRW